MSARDESLLRYWRPVSSVDRYDLLLLAIPLAFTLGTGGALAAGTTVETGYRTGALLSTLLTGYALFGTPPNVGRSRITDSS